MPKRTDISTILLIGSGPIVIGQACEFDYSGTQAAKTLKELGYKVVLINSNPATIMTDPQFAHATYIEPITKESILRIIEREKCDAILPTMGGQVALNVAMQVYESPEFRAKNVKFLGAKPEAIKKGEDRQVFKECMKKIGMDLPKSAYAYDYEEAERAAGEIGFPLMIRASYTLGGAGSGVVYNMDEFKELATSALALSPIHEILIEESLLGWKEFEMEVIRDKNDNCIIVCSIENFDPMGVHTGDSITVAPALTLTDKEYQVMRNASFAILREIGVDTGGSNVQFAINPKNGRMIVIEMNPRVSRSSALASKATGYPIAKVATLLAVGFSLDEIKNDITGTPASFEPVIDYIVTKIPRFAFEKFPSANATLGTAMKSVGEVMAMGSSFKESIQKALCSLERGLCGFEALPCDKNDLIFNLRNPNEKRLLYIAQAFRAGLCVDEIYELCRVDKWFLEQIWQIVEFERQIDMDILNAPERLRLAKSMGFSDEMIAALINAKDNLQLTQNDIYYARSKLGIRACFNEVDTCAGEFKALTPYLYSTTNENSGLESVNLALDSENLGLGRENSQKNCHSEPATAGEESTIKNQSLNLKMDSSHSANAQNDEVGVNFPPNSSQNSQPKKVMIIGGGPNRIGQGIEFDYCCVHACFALKDLGVRTIMYNSNPETVSTDYDTSDTLYFEPIDFEHLRAVIEREKPDGIIVHFGGQTPLKFAKRLTAFGARIIGTSARVIDLAEDRKKFAEFINKIGINQPKNATATSVEEAVLRASEINYPVLVRPSYVLGGRAMRAVHSESELRLYMQEAVDVSEKAPVLIDQFLHNATELDVDAICDGADVYVGGIMEHIEEAGIHSGDSACSLPPCNLSEKTINLVQQKTREIALNLGVVGLLNIQFALYNDELFMIEVNPRASRTVPFVSKATGVPLAKVATRVMWQGNLREALKFYDAYGVVCEKNGVLQPKNKAFVAVKEAVFPFAKLSGSDLELGPEMRSTGEVMGIGKDFANAFAKSQISAFNDLPKGGAVFVSLKDSDKIHAKSIASAYVGLGFKLIATGGTCKAVREAGFECEQIYKISEGRPNVEDSLKNGEIQLVINTSDTSSNKDDTRKIRANILRFKIPYFTNLRAANAGARAIKAMQEGSYLEVKSLQEWLG